VFFIALTVIGSQLFLQIKYGNMFRRIRDSRFPDFSDYGPDMTFSKLEETIRRIFKLPETFKFDMVYTDNDNDEVTMTDDGDIRDAVVYQKLNPLRVTVLAQESQRSAFDDSLRECRDRIVHSSNSSQG